MEEAKVPNLQDAMKKEGPMDEQKGEHGMRRDHWHVFAHVGGFGTLADLADTLYVDDYEDVVTAAKEEILSLAEGHLWWSHQIPEEEINEILRDLAEWGEDGVAWTCPVGHCLYSLEAVHCKYSDCMGDEEECRP